jgi:poly-gamma-glutamate synthesis protein (capsule biosynthesis protein)
MELLDRLGIAYTGVSTAKHPRKYLCLEQHGVKIGIYAATYGLNFESRYDPTKVLVNQLKGLAPPDRSAICLNEIVEVLEKMKNDGINLKVISLHWGYEFELFPDPLVQELARRIVLAGADVIVGSHPHVPQPVEIFYLNHYNDASETTGPCPVRLTDQTGIARKAVVFYSLGNFVTRMYTPMCQAGVIASISVFKENATGITDWAFNEMAFVYNHVPLFPGRKHKLMLLADYHDRNLHLLSMKRKIRFLHETNFIMRHIKQ